MRFSSRWSGGLSHGQPVHATHPNILKTSTKVMPGIDRSELLSRREKLMAELGEEAIAVIPSYRMQYSSQNILYPLYNV